ncbi:mast cell protease 1A-like [Drosophila kikkawai]|uniref:Mast cell protease 1A-like n=1 Tax=Drosophila kikkawai TaxID=30033 RepID=A0ABM4GB64_DROKI
MKITGGLTIVLLYCAILGNGQKSVSFLEPNCGLTNSRARTSRYRIIGGVTADMYGHPWMAFIRSNVDCGGSLISDRFVLSAAHCMTGHPTTVYLGQFDMSRGTANAIQVPVDLQIPYPQYTNTKKDIKNDIGLFRLARTVQYTNFIRPICLPTNYNPLAQTSQLTATGWGKTEHGVASSVLKTTTLTQHNRGTCSSTFKTNVDMSQICAGASNSATCSGDSGGPITAAYAIAGRNRVIQLGIVSYGEQFCRTVGVYTNVMHYISWITNVVRRAGSAPAPTQRPNHNEPTHTNNNNNNNIYYYYPTPNTPYDYTPRQDSPMYYYPDSNSPTYYYPNGNAPVYYMPSGNSPVYYYPGNYVVYG